MFVGLHTGAYIVFECILSLSESFEKQICDPASAGISEGHEIWKVNFRRWFLFMELDTGAYIAWDAHSFSVKSLKTKSVIQRRLDLLNAVRFGRYVLDDCFCLLGFMRELT